ncbi:4697_t:CDS:2, partial [Rhizophagus irregularis]
NLDNNTFPSIKGGKIPLEDVVDNAYYSKHRKRLREKNILFLDQIISGDKSRLLLWKEILIKAYIPIFSQRRETKWYSDIRSLITLDGVHLNHNITQLFGARVDNVEETRSYDITKKNRSLIAFYNPQFNSVLIANKNSLFCKKSRHKRGYERKLAKKEPEVAAD